MKLYTEDQVKDMLNRVMMLEHHTVEFLNKYYTPIELPTDAEIGKTAKEKNVGLSRDVANYRGCFEQGAKWMRDKILNK